MSETLTPKETTLISVVEIANIYGYAVSSLAVMSTRYPDFPKAQGREGNANLYSATEIEAWFTQYRSKGGKKFGTGRSLGGRGVSQVHKRNVLLEEIISRIHEDLVLQSKVLLYLEEVATK